MLEPRLLARLTQKKTQLDALRPLPAAAVNRLNEQLTLEWIYNSNAIEGNTLTLRETQLILETGLTIGGKSLREHLEVINHQQAIEYVETLVNSPDLITPFHLRQIHRLVLSRIDDTNAGQYRNLPVKIAGSSHQPPDAWAIPQLIDDWGSWLNGPAQGLHPIERAAVAHHRLVAIHPFLDGNGRTARLVMNLLLLRDGYPPTVILRANRRQYYRVLAQADAGHEGPLVNFIGRAVERSLTLYLEACIPVSTPPAREVEWIPLGEAAKETPYSQEYLSLLARTGRLEAVKRGRVWYTTRHAIAAYQASLHSH
ncbi:MAG: cell division protein Fic [Chloroflexota bacterium]|nr:MAG: cell division protein Fic [Chloroflexota bacterium]